MEKRGNANAGRKDNEIEKNVGKGEHPSEEEREKWRWERIENGGKLGKQK